MLSVVYCDMALGTPILSKLNQAKDARSGRSFDLAIGTLNSALIDKKIWNVEITDAKFTLSNGVNLALGVMYDRYLGKGGRTNYEPWTSDLSMYCSFNQAAGRIKRLHKNAPKTQIVSDFIAAYQEVDAIWKAICELKPLIVKGRRPNENKTEAQVAVELRNTGVCAICDRRQKLDDNSKMVHHGYQMSDYNHSGYRMGKCFGTGYPCYEFSNEALLAYAPFLQSKLSGYVSALKSLKSGTILTLTVNRKKFGNNWDITVLKKGTPEFDRELASQISQTEQFIKYTKFDIVTNDAKIKNWVPQLLMYGGKKA